ncbi:alpha-1,4-glucan:maltose-1-phosphate maltosyltransferase [Frankineae bacterium MT45]|nr:alpha-1,4-glucan:maltose-1-phosphate maltosyltransferase [Frankineae bacterium MT45]
MAGRIGLNSVRPVVANGEYPARAVVGEEVEVSAIVFREGHDAVAANVALKPPGTGKAVSTRLLRTAEPGLDRWAATVTFDEPGLWSFVVEAWSDPLTTWHHALTVKLEAGQGVEDLENDLATGAILLEQVARSLPKPRRAGVLAAAEALKDQKLDLAHRAAPALDAQLQLLLHAHPIRELVTKSPRHTVWVDRTRALHGSWYEFFPRSIGAELVTDDDGQTKPVKHGTFATAAKHLDYVAGLGFDVVYLPPIHPIGETNRKGPNNTLVAASWDVGSPWAIGSIDGGHDAIHPALGTMADFKAFVARAKKLKLEVALDYALQCAPDHPWVKSHPEWFTTKPDGSIAYAENPPKKYQDIYPLNFDNDPKGLYAECRRVLQVWIDAGVRIFRVDNPHTKPINFWQWLISTVKKDHPDVLFLAEAFTTPAMMHELARVGFTQSYTYYTWRNTNEELRTYAEELVEAADYMRPNFFVNTPDILPEYLQHSGPSGFKIRAILAATLSPTWGVYSGYELFERLPVRAGSEEYLDSEKYQLRPRDFASAEADGRSLAPLLRQLNQIRSEHKSLHRLRNLKFHPVENDAMLAYSKTSGDDTILVVCSTDPYNVRESWTWLDMPALGFDWHDRFDAHDLLTGRTFDWGQNNFVRLDPHDPTTAPAHILHIRPKPWG